MERAVEVQEEAGTCRAGSGDDPGVDDPAQMFGVLVVQRPGQPGEHRHLDECPELQRGVEVGRGVLDDPEPAGPRTCSTMPRLVTRAAPHAPA